MERYNKYLGIIPNGGCYDSEIAFVESFDDFDKNFLYRDEHWVEFNDSFKRHTGFYQIDIGVSNFYGKVKDDFLKKCDGKVVNITSAHRHYVYVKIIDDKVNSQLNGQIMLFMYGRKIYDIIQSNKGKTFSRSFMLKVKMTQQFLNFDECHFTTNNYYIRDLNLNIQNIPSLRKLDILKDIERRFKLDKIVKKQLDIKMRKYVCSPFGEEVDLDNPETFSYLPDDPKQLDDMMFKEIGQALVYMDFFHPRWFTEGKDGGQRKKVMERIKYFADNRKEHYGDVKWLKEQVFLIQDETENMC